MTRRRHTVSLCIESEQGKTMLIVERGGGKYSTRARLTCNSTLCATQVLPVFRSEVLVKHRIQTACLGLVPVHTILLTEKHKRVSNVCFC